MKCVDLSLPLENDDVWLPWWDRNRVTYQAQVRCVRDPISIRREEATFADGARLGKRKHRVIAARHDSYGRSLALRSGVRRSTGEDD